MQTFYNLYYIKPCPLIKLQSGLEITKDSLIPLKAAALKFKMYEMIITHFLLIVLSSFKRDAQNSLRICILFVYCKKWWELRCVFMTFDKTKAFRNVLLYVYFAVHAIKGIFCNRYEKSRLNIFSPCHQKQEVLINKFIGFASAGPMP